MNKMSFDELLEVVSVCLSQIAELKQENQALKNEINGLSANMRELVQGISTITKNRAEEHRNFMLWKKTYEQALDNLQYEWNDPRVSGREYVYPKFHQIEDTIEAIVSHGCSMARFGDGEFALMSGKCRQSFQHMDERLAERLREVIASREEGMLIGIADNYGSLKAYNLSSKQDIRLYMTEEIRAEHMRFLDPERIYHNAYISRPYALYADNRTDAPAKRFCSLKRIWENRSIIFVEGTLTRLGVGNNLFDNAKAIRRIEAPPVNAFDRYDDILSAALRYAEKDSLFLIAIGPSAGVLAFDLHQAGYQALDIGHMDLEYEWFLRGTGSRCEVKGKYNHEYRNGEQVEPIKDEQYFSEIVCTVA